MARKRPIMTFLQKCVSHLPLRHIESILLVPQQSISQMEVGLGSILDALLYFLGKGIPAAR
jgi:hypothetical protein